MRILLIVFIGLAIADPAIAYSQRSSATAAASASPYYVNGQPLMSNPNPEDRTPEEKAARTAHRAALNGVYDAVGYPLRTLCAPEQRAAFMTALNTYYLDRLRFERRGGWFRPDEWKGTAFDWHTPDDQAIERLTILGFSRRHFVIGELDRRIASVVTDLVRGKQAQAQCEEETELWPAHFTHEQFQRGAREGYRAEALAALTSPWARARSCDRGARRLMMYAVESYQQERVRQQTELMSWGTLGMRRASALWSTEDDRAIDDHVRTMLREGYLSLEDIRKEARPMVMSLMDGEVGAPRCPEQAAKAK